MSRCANPIRGIIQAGYPPPDDLTPTVNLSLTLTLFPGEGQTTAHRQIFGQEVKSIEPNLPKLLSILKLDSNASILNMDSK